MPTDKSENLLEDLVGRVLDVLETVLPASTLNRLSEQIRPAIDTVLAPFQILRRDDFEGYLRQLERLEAEVADLHQQVAELQTQGIDRGA